jgi:hypothetical protein
MLLISFVTRADFPELVAVVPPREVIHDKSSYTVTQEAITFHSWSSLARDTSSLDGPQHRNKRALQATFASLVCHPNDEGTQVRPCHLPYQISAAQVAELERSYSHYTFEQAMHELATTGD